MVTLAGNLFLHLGLHKGDMLYVDGDLEPREGEIVVLEDPEDDAGNTLAIYLKSAHSNRKVVGTVCGFRRWFLTRSVV